MKKAKRFKQSIRDIQFNGVTGRMYSFCYDPPYRNTSLTSIGGQGKILKIKDRYHASNIAMTGTEVRVYINPELLYYKR